MVRSPNSERGATLVVSLLMLIMVTLLGLAAMRTSTLETRMARNAREQLVAFQAAEGALRDAEADIVAPTRGGAPGVSGAAGFAADCNPGSATLRGLCLSPTAGTTQVWRSAAATAWVPYGTYTGRNVLASGGVAGVSVQPSYLVEVITTPLPGQSLKVHTANARYRITAQGIGPSAPVQYMVQTTFRP
ncbi:PilX N-terminal domain-containing pilus assembly protein [Niveibacterium sp.]|uniref:pilus assembly PilX family protein n=1 Tax=Niveibacterium sp. TaxID=2017444 RepID=UPI0035B0E9D2